MNRKTARKIRILQAKYRIAHPSFDAIAKQTIREVLEREAHSPMRGGNAAPPARGLFDKDHQDQIDLF